MAYSEHALKWRAENYARLTGKWGGCKGFVWRALGKRSLLMVTTLKMKNEIRLILFIELSFRTCFQLKCYSNRVRCSQITGKQRTMNFLCSREVLVYIVYPNVWTHRKYIKVIEFFSRHVVACPCPVIFFCYFIFFFFILFHFWCSAYELYTVDRIGVMGNIQFSKALNQKHREKKIASH